VDIGTKTDPIILSSTPQSMRTGDKGQSVEKAAESFESFLLQTMLKELDKAMRITKRSFAEDTQMSLFYEKIGDFMAKKGIGIKEMLVKYVERGAKVSPKKSENVS
jgi:Rod binding domain-containing protein